MQSTIMLALGLIFARVKEQRRSSGYYLMAYRRPKLAVKVGPWGKQTFGGGFIS